MSSMRMSVDLENVLGVKDIFYGACGSHRATSSSTLMAPTFIYQILNLVVMKIWRRC